MEVPELKQLMTDLRTKLKTRAQSGKHLVATSENGPIGIDTIDALVSTIEALENRVKQLEENRLTKG